MPSVLQKLTLKFIPGLAATTLKLLGLSYRFHEINSEKTSPLRNKDAHYLFAFWHGQLLAVVEHFRCSRICAMASRNKDGELISRSLVKLGYPEPARGSSSRGGAAALKNLADLVKQGYCAVLTPDGPRGPRHVVQTGILSLAKITQIPIVPLGFAAQPALQLKSWDGFLIPLPFARGTFVFDEPIVVPKDCDEKKMAILRLKLQHSLNRMTQLARESLQ